MEKRKCLTPTQIAVQIRERLVKIEEKLAAMKTVQNPQVQILCRTLEGERAAYENVLDLIQFKLKRFMY